MLDVSGYAELRTDWGRDEADIRKRAWVGEEFRGGAGGAGWVWCHVGASGEGVGSSDAGLGEVAAGSGGGEGGLGEFEGEGGGGGLLGDVVLSLRGESAASERTCGVVGPGEVSVHLD